LASVFSAPAQAQGRRNDDRVCFYSDAHYRGDSFCAKPGESLPNVGGRFNDRISSIRIYGRLEVTIFENEGFEGGSRSFNRDAANLQDLGWNDKITSIQVSGGERGGSGNDRGFGSDRGGFERGGGFGNDRRGLEPRNGACFYVNSDFRGQSFCLSTGEEDRNVGRRFNDRISSLRIFGRARVTTYSDEDFRGPRREFHRDVSNLGGMNDQITSIRVR